MKIVIFGLTLSSSWGNGHATPYRAILKALSRLGHTVVFFEKDVPYYAQRRDLLQPDFCELVLYPSWEEVAARALAEARSADVVVNASYCPEGSAICDAILALDGPLRVFYDLDTPITLGAFSGQGADYVRAEQIPHFDLVLSFTGGAVMHELESRWGARMARPLYGCVDPDVHAGVPELAEFRNLMSYMGTYAADREEKMEALFLEPVRRRTHDPFVLAGSMYPSNWIWPSNLKRYEHLSPDEHPALYSSSRFTLNITREGMARSGFCPSGRFFEATACGTPVITDWFAGLDSFFTPGHEIIVVHSTEEVMQALALSGQTVSDLAKRARERTLDEHSGEFRARQMLAYFEEARSSKEEMKMEVAR